MKYAIPCLLALFIILVFYPNDYDDTGSTIYIGNVRHYSIYDRQSVYTGPDTAAASGRLPGAPNNGGMGEWAMPVNAEEGFYVSSLIGYRILGGTAPSYHRGFDLANGKSGSAVTSIGDGSVVDIKQNPNNSSGFGICLTVRYNSADIGNFCVIYAHLSSYDTSLAIGSAVKKGQEIGKVGNTGVGTGSHLHWQCFYGVQYTDLYNSFNPFQTLYTVENNAKSISEAYGFAFYEPENYSAENTFYAVYAENGGKYLDYYEENQKLGMIPDDFFN